MTWEESAEQVMPQMKWVARGVEQGSEEKFQDARQDQGEIEEGAIEALKEARAKTSDGFVRERTDEIRKGKTINTSNRVEEEDDMVMMKVFYFVSYDEGFYGVLVW